MHPNRMALKETHVHGDKYLFKALNQISCFHVLLAVQFTYLITCTVPVTVIAEIFTVCSCENKVAFYKGKAEAEETEKLA